MHLIPVMLMEYQSPNLDALPARHIISRQGVLKRSMRHPPRPAINLAIEALDQQNLARL